MELNDIYLTLRKQHLCKNGHDFSVRYLGRKKSYYSSIKARNRQPSAGAIIHLYFKLKEQAELIKGDENEVLYKIHRQLLTMSSEVMRKIKISCVIKNATN